MDPQQKKDHNSHLEDMKNGSNLEDMMNGSNACGKISTSSYHSRQSSTRWTPTTEQIKLLKELYYINGLRSPTADQIHTICARLRCYGKVEGKNVFYWFQNHKARERQKKKLTPNSSSNPTLSAPQYHNNTIIRKRGLDWKEDQDLTVHNKYLAINNSGVSSSSTSAAVVAGGVHLVESFMYGAVTTGNKVRESSMSEGGLLNGGSANPDFEWAAVNYNIPTVPASYSHFFDEVSANDDDHDQDHYKASEIETLPLFPMHSEEHHDHDHNHHLVPAGFCAMKTGSDGYYTGGCWWVHGSRGSASLELSLKSYGYGYYPPKL